MPLNLEAGLNLVTVNDITYHLEPDSVVLRDPSGPHWFLWRLNGGEWSASQTANEMNLTALPPGNCCVEIQALDRHLQPSPPAAAAFSIRVAPGAQIARWVSALLHGTEAAREAAVAGLIKQPDAALLALQAAYPSASEDGRWWLDAAIQQIQRNQETKIQNSPE